MDSDAITCGVEILDSHYLHTELEARRHFRGIEFKRELCDTEGCSCKSESSVATATVQVLDARQIWQTSGSKHSAALMKQKIAALMLRLQTSGNGRSNSNCCKLPAARSEPDFLRFAGATNRRSGRSGIFIVPPPLLTPPKPRGTGGKMDGPAAKGRLGGQVRGSEFYCLR